MAVVEIALFPLKEGLCPDANFSNPAGHAWRKISRFLKAQDRVGDVWFACQVEKPTWAILITEFESVNAHWDFQATPQFPPFIDEIGSLMVIPEHSMLHVHFDPHPSVALRNAHEFVTEFVILFFPPHHPQADVDQIHKNQQKFSAIMQESSESFYAATGGWADVLLHPPGSAASARVYVALFAWASVEAHNNVKETRAFKDNISLLAGLKGLRHMESFHFIPQELAK